MLTPTTRNQLEAYKERLIRLNDLDPSLRAEFLNEFVAQRVGFKPDSYCQVAGVTFEGRQTKIALAANLCEFKRSPPIELLADPTNVYDKHAVKVMLGTLQLDDGAWHLDHVGFIPRGVCLDCGSNLTGRMVKKPKCTYCDSGNIDLAFNERVSIQLLLEEEVEVGVDWISNRKDNRDSYLGVRLALAGF